MVIFRSFATSKICGPPVAAVCWGWSLCACARWRQSIDSAGQRSQRLHTAAHIASVGWRLTYNGRCTCWRDETSSLIGCRATTSQRIDLLRGVRTANRSDCWFRSALQQFCNPPAICGLLQKTCGRELTANRRFSFTRNFRISSWNNNNNNNNIVSFITDNNVGYRKAAYHARRTHDICKQWKRTSFGRQSGHWCLHKVLARTL